MKEKKILLVFSGIVTLFFLFAVLFYWAPALSVNNEKDVDKITKIINQGDIQIIKMSPIEDYDSIVGQNVTYLDSDTIEHKVFIQNDKKILKYVPVKVYKMLK